MEAASGAPAPKPRRKTSATPARRPPAKAEAPVSLANGRGDKVAPAAAEPSREAIARLAYHYWLERGGADGWADEDWLRAERELRQRVLKASA